MPIKIYIYYINASNTKKTCSTRRRRRKTRHATRRKQKKTRRRRSARRHRRRRTRRRRRRTYRGGAGFWENFGSALKTAGAQIGSGAAAVVKYGRNQGAKLAAGGLELATGGVGTGAINQPRSFSYNPETTKDSGFSMEDVEYIPYTYSTLGSRMAWAWQTAAVQNRHILLNIADFTTKASRAGDLRSAVGAELNDVISASPEDLYDDNLQESTGYPINHSRTTTSQLYIGLSNSRASTTTSSSSTPPRTNRQESATRIITTSMPHQKP